MKKIVLDSNECIGCDLCVDICPKMFTSTSFLPKVNKIDASSVSCIDDAVEICPAGALSIIEVN